MRGALQDRRRLRRASRVVALALAGAVLAAAAARAQDAMWLVNPGSNDFNTGSNWNTGSVPTGTAFFGTSNTTSLTFSVTPTIIGSWTFNTGASAYTFFNTRVLRFTGAGIVVNGGSAIISNSALGIIEFENHSTAGSATITNNSPDGQIVFMDNSTAGSASITNNHVVIFENNSTAGSAAVTNIGAVIFFNTSTAGSAAITDDGSNSDIQFRNSSTAGNATIINNGSMSSILFFDTSTAGNATIINNAGGTVDFSASSGLAGNNQVSAGSIAGAGNVYLGANQLTVGGNNVSTTVNGVISDCGAGGTTCNAFPLSLPSTGGSLVKVGTGTLTLAGDNAYTGATVVNGGTLAVNGSITASSGVTVNSGGTLSGTGTVSGTQVNSSGTLAPGPIGGIGTLNISGSLMFQSAALYMVTVSGGSASSTNVSGTASLGGTVQVAFASAPTATTYDILHSAGIACGYPYTARGCTPTTFAGVTSLNPNYDANLSYTTTDVFLNLTAALGAGTPLNQNQRSVASGLNNFFNSGGALPPNFATIFGLTGPALANALSQLDGEASTDAEKGAFDLMTQFLDLMLDPFVDGRGGAAGGNAMPFAPERETSFPPDIALAYDAILKAPPKQILEQRWTAWGAPFGAYNKSNGDLVVGSNNVIARDFGFAAGMDYHFSPDTLAGFSLSGGGTSWGLAQGLGTGRSGAFAGGIYAKTHSGSAYLAGALAFADHWFTTNRTAAWGDQLTASFNGQSIGGRAEGGNRFAVAPMLGVTPYAALQAQGFHTPAYREADMTGGGFGLAYNAMNATDTRSELGSRFDGLTMLGAMPLILRGRFAWAHDWVSNPALGAVFQALPGTNFIVNGAAPPKNSALTTAAAELHITRNWSATTKFDGEFAKNSQTYAGTETLRYQW